MYLIPVLLLIMASCASKQSYEMEELSKDVLSSKSGQGIDIEVKPIAKDK